MKEEHDWKKHIEDFKAEKLLKANQKNKRLAIDMRLLKERMAKLKEENAELKQQIRDIKNADPKTRKMSQEDFKLYNEGVALVRSEYLNSLKQQFADLYRRKLELEKNKDTEKNRLKRHINAISMGSILDEIEENAEKIDFKYN